MPNKLSDLVVDEISLVYKGANQHSRVAIAKSLDGQQEETVEIFDQDGNPVDPDTLELGDVVFDNDGQAYQYSDEEDDGENEYVDDSQLETVGKAIPLRAAGIGGRGMRIAGQAVRGGRKGAGAASSFARQTAGTARNVGGNVAGDLAGSVKRAGSRAAWKANAGATRLADMGSARAVAGGYGAARGARQAVGNRGFQLGAAGVGGAGAGAAGTVVYNRHVNKNFGDEVREELSKALSDDARDDVISKAFDYVEYLEEVAKSAEETAESERTIRRQTEYLEIAKSYSLPVNDEDLAEAMMAVEDNVAPEYVDIIAQCLAAASEGLYDEIGKTGNGAPPSDVMNQIEQYANNTVQKSDTTNAEVVSKAFESDPSLYDRYLSETGYYNR